MDPLAWLRKQLEEADTDLLRAMEEVDELKELAAASQ